MNWTLKYLVIIKKFIKKSASLSVFVILVFLRTTSLKDVRCYRLVALHLSLSLFSFSVAVSLFTTVRRNQPTNQPKHNLFLLIIYFNISFLVTNHNKDFAQYCDQEDCLQKFSKQIVSTLNIGCRHRNVSQLYPGRFLFFFIYRVPL